MAETAADDVSADDVRDEVFESLKEVMVEMYKEKQTFIRGLSDEAFHATVMQQRGAKADDFYADKTLFTAAFNQLVSSVDAKKRETLAWGSFFMLWSNAGMPIVTYNNIVVLNVFISGVFAQLEGLAKRTATAKTTAGEVQASAKVPKRMANARTHQQRLLQVVKGHVSKWNTAQVTLAETVIAQYRSRCARDKTTAVSKAEAVGLLLAHSLSLGSRLQVVSDEPDANSSTLGISISLEVYLGDKFETFYGGLTRRRNKNGSYAPPTFSITNITRRIASRLNKPESSILQGAEFKTFLADARAGVVSPPKLAGGVYSPFMLEVLDLIHRRIEASTVHNYRKDFPEVAKWSTMVFLQGGARGFERVCEAFMVASPEAMTDAKLRAESRSIFPTSRTVANWVNDSAESLGLRVRVGYHPDWVRDAVTKGIMRKGEAGWRPRVILCTDGIFTTARLGLDAVEGDVLNLVLANDVDGLVATSSSGVKVSTSKQFEAIANATYAQGQWSDDGELWCILAADEATARAFTAGVIPLCLIPRNATARQGDIIDLKAALTEHLNTAGIDVDFFCSDNCGVYEKAQLADCMGADDERVWAVPAGGPSFGDDTFFGVRALRPLIDGVLSGTLAPETALAPLSCTDILHILVRIYCRLVDDGVTFPTPLGSFGRQTLIRVITTIDLERAAGRQVVAIPVTLADARKADPMSFHAALRLFNRGTIDALNQACVAELEGVRALREMVSLFVPFAEAARLPATPENPTFEDRLRNCVNALACLRGHVDWLIATGRNPASDREPCFITRQAYRSLERFTTCMLYLLVLAVRKGGDTCELRPWVLSSERVELLWRLIRSFTPMCWTSLDVTTDELAGRMTKALLLQNMRHDQSTGGVLLGREDDETCPTKIARTAIMPSVGSSAPLVVPIADARRILREVDTIWDAAFSGGKAYLVRNNMLEAIKVAEATADREAAAASAAAAAAAAVIAVADRERVQGLADDRAAKAGVRCEKPGCCAHRSEHICSKPLCQQTMYQCDYCNAWSHQACIPRARRPGPDEGFLCANCAAIANQGRVHCWCGCSHGAEADCSKCRAKLLRPGAFLQCRDCEAYVHRDCVRQKHHVRGPDGAELTPLQIRCWRCAPTAPSTAVAARGPTSIRPWRVTGAWALMRPSVDAAARSASRLLSIEELRGIVAAAQDHSDAAVPAKTSNGRLLDTDGTHLSSACSKIVKGMRSGIIIRVSRQQQTRSIVRMVPENLHRALNVGFFYAVNAAAGGRPAAWYAAEITAFHNVGHKSVSTLNVDPACVTERALKALKKASAAVTLYSVAGTTFSLFGTAELPVLAHLFPRRCIQVTRAKDAQTAVVGADEWRERTATSDASPAVIAAVGGAVDQGLPPDDPMELDDPEELEVPTTRKRKRKQNGAGARGARGRDAEVDGEAAGAQPMEISADVEGSSTSSEANQRRVKRRKQGRGRRAAAGPAQGEGEGESCE